MSYRKKTHIQTQIMFLPSSYILGQFTLIFKQVKRDLLSVNLQCYTLIRRRQQISV